MCYRFMCKKVKKETKTKEQITKKLQAYISDIKKTRESLDTFIMKRASKPR